MKFLSREKIGVLAVWIVSIAALVVLWRLAGARGEMPDRGAAYWLRLGSVWSPAPAAVLTWFWLGKCEDEEARYLGRFLLLLLGELVGIVGLALLAVQVIR